MENEQILTIIEATVSEDRWETLKQEFNAVRKADLPSAVLTAQLVQDRNKPTTWRIVTMWESLEAITKYRESVEKPVWIVVFEKADSKPELIINTIVLSK